MPDLGKYAVEVLSAYGVSILMIAVLVLASFVKGAKVRRQLAEAEARRGTIDGV